MADLTGKKVALIIASRNFRDEEFSEPKALLEQAGAEITVASSTGEAARGMFGMWATPNTTIHEIDPDAFDAVVFVGGSGAHEYFSDPTAHEIARKAAEIDTVLGAICIAPSTLANAGVLEGKRATSYPSEKENLIRRGAQYTGSLVEVDGKLITGIGPEAARSFGEALIQALE
jgi:protease I